MTGATPGRPFWRGAGFVVLAACVFGFLAFGIRSGTGLFLAPVSADLKWGREVFAFAVAVQNLVWGLCVPVAGAIADKHGAGRVLAVGALLYAAGFALMAQSATPALMQLTVGLLVGMGLAGTSFTIVIAVVSRAVRPEKRVFTIGLCTATMSLGQFALLPLGQDFIRSYGWQSAALILGAIALAMLPLSAAVTGKGAPAPGMRDQPLAAALGEAFRTKSFVLVVVAFFVCGFQLMFMANHLPAYLADKGLPPWVGGWTLAMVGLFNVAGEFLAGWAGGIWPKKYGLAFIYTARAVAITAFLLLPLTPLSALIFGAVMGFLWLSTVPLTSGLVATFFGLRWLATLFGIAFLGHQIGSFFGVWLGGLLFDIYKSYDLVWWINVALGAIAAVLHLPVREAAVPRLAGPQPA